MKCTVFITYINIYNLTLLNSGVSLILKAISRSAMSKGSTVPLLLQTLALLFYSISSLCTPITLHAYVFVSWQWWRTNAFLWIGCQSLNQIYMPRVVWFNRLICSIQMNIEVVVCWFYYVIPDMKSKFSIWTLMEILNCGIIYELYDRFLSYIIE